MEPSEEQVLWERTSWLMIGQALLDRGVPMTAAEIASAIDRDPSNTRRAAHEMVDADLLEARPCTHEHLARGRRAQSEFSLRKERVAVLRELLPESIAPGLLRPGQQMVFAQAAGGGLVEMADALAEAGFATRGRWGAICDGDPQEYVMVFDGAGAIRAAVDLMSMLTAAEVRCRRISVADLMPAHELATWSSDTAHRARRLRKASRARSAARP